MRNIMNKWQKVGLAAGMGTAVIATTHIINKFIFKYATINNYTFENKSENSYGWKFGNIAYSAYGDKNASPLLLIHDLNAYSSGYEWNNVIQHLSDTHYVYVLDMLGCGHSDKPHITYTTYMYTQLLNDFITNVIGKPTDIMATGSSAPIAIGAAFTNNALYNKILLVSPEAVSRAGITPGKRANIRRKLLSIPVIGTTIYNICVGKDRLNKILGNKVFSDNLVPIDYLNACHENAHLSGASSKYLFSSTECNYTTVSISKAVKELNNCIYIIHGDNFNTETLNEYTSLNSAIETVNISGSGLLPQVEQPDEFIKQCEILLFN